MKRSVIIIVFAVVLAACGGGSSNTAATTTTTTVVPDTAFTVHVVVTLVGFGCTGNTPVGTGSRLVAKDGSGSTIGTATFALTAGADSCDWTTKMQVKGSPEFVTLEGEHGQLATLNRQDLADGKVTLDVDSNGSVKVA